MLQAVAIKDKSALYPVGGGLSSSAMLWRMAAAVRLEAILRFEAELTGHLSDVEDYLKSRRASRARQRDPAAP